MRWDEIPNKAELSEEETAHQRGGHRKSPVLARTLSKRLGSWWRLRDKSLCPSAGRGLCPRLASREGSSHTAAPHRPRHGRAPPVRQPRPDELRASAGGAARLLSPLSTQLRGQVGRGSSKPSEEAWAGLTQRPLDQMSPGTGLARAHGRPEPNSPGQRGAWGAGRSPAGARGPAPTLGSPPRGCTVPDTASGRAPSPQVRGAGVKQSSSTLRIRRNAGSSGL